MRVRWSPEAADDLEHIVEYIRRENPSAGQRVAQTIYELVGALETLPYRGRAGRIEGTRELPLPSLPFILIYRVLDRVNAVEIINIIHGAQRWPPSA
jgi:toxin ParE1/3/4